MIIKVTGKINDLIIQKIDHSNDNLVQLDISNKYGLSSIEIGRLNNLNKNGKKIEFVNAKRSVMVQWKMLKMDELFSIYGQ